MKNRNKRMGDLDIIIPDPSEFEGPSIIGIAITLCIFPPLGVYLGFKKLYNMHQRGKHENYWRYASILRHRPEIGIAELARMTHRPVPIVTEDLRAMFSKGYFGNAYYMDESAGRIYCRYPGVFRPEVYQDPMVQGQMGSGDTARQEDSKGRVDISKESETQNTGSPMSNTAASKKQQPLSSRFDSNLRRIRELNDSIQSVEVSKKIDRIGMLTASIFSTVQYTPERANDIRKLMDYYLPTTFKLLEMYAMMESQSYKSEEVLQSMERISGMMDSLIQAFEVQQSRLMQADTLNVDAEIKALESILASDGLVLPKGADIHDFMRTTN